MFGWLVRIFSIAGGVIAGWFVGRDAPNYSFIQMVATLMLIVATVALLAFWPARWNPFRDDRADKETGRTADRR